MYLNKPSRCLEERDLSLTGGVLPVILVLQSEFDDTPVYLKKGQPFENDLNSLIKGDEHEEQGSQPECYIRLSLRFSNGGRLTDGMK